MPRGKRGRPGHRRPRASQRPKRPSRWRRPLIAGSAAIPVGLAVAAALVVSQVDEPRISDQPVNADGDPPAEALSTEEFFASEGDEAPAPAAGAELPPQERGSAESEFSGEDADSDSDDDSDSDAESSGSSSGGGGGGGGGGSSVANARAAQVVDLVNDERADAGCDPLRVDDSLTTAAQAHSEDMADRDYMAHDTPEGVGPAERVSDAGYGAFGGENVAAGQGSAQAVMNAWMASEGHRNNILNCDFQAIGVGEQDRFWTQNFGFA